MRACRTHSLVPCPHACTRVHTHAGTPAQALKTTRGVARRCPYEQGQAYAHPQQQNRTAIACHRAAVKAAPGVLAGDGGRGTHQPGRTHARTPPGLERWVEMVELALLPHLCWYEALRRPNQSMPAVRVLVLAKLLSTTRKV
jgi:hypothetical protein